MRTFKYNGETYKEKSGNFDKNVADIKLALIHLKNHNPFTKSDFRTMITDKSNAVTTKGVILKNISRVRKIMFEEVFIDNADGTYSTPEIPFNQLAERIEKRQWEIGQKALIDSRKKHSNHYEIPLMSKEEEMSEKIRKEVDKFNELLGDAEDLGLEVELSINDNIGVEIDKITKDY